MSAPSRIGPYTIEREIGRGGMGVVYLGRDPRLSREVAIKMLPEAFAQDPERVQRFEREARLLASLSHPNIAGIHGLEEQDGHRYLVLEYVPGETLAERIARGPLSIDDAAEVCVQIAAALEAAHESGVIHRDLKPGNVKITPTGEVKVLDFGLARGASAASGVSASDLSQSPTMAVTATGAGVILGTAAYMSPEQARAKAVDRRTDIWSFGCVLYECLTGQRAFEGETVSDMIALILQGEPDWKALPAGMPPRVRALLERCLEKDAKKRLRDIGEAKLMLEAPHEPVSGIGEIAPPAAATGRPLVLAWSVAALFGILSAVLLWRAFVTTPKEAAVTRLLLLPPPGVSQPREPAFASFSPDGRMLAFACFDTAGPPAIWVRALDQTEARRLPGTERSLIPAWSPDGESIVVATTEKLVRIDLRGGAPQNLADARTSGRGASWGSRDVIVYAPGGEGPLYRVSANGGAAEQVTVLDSIETAHRFPEFLPDGVHFLYAALPAINEGFNIFIGSIDGGMREFLMNCDGVPRYAEPGWLVYTRGGRVLAQRFDAARRRLGAQTLKLTDEPAITDYLGASRLIVSRRGPIAYQTGGHQSTELAVLDRAGHRLRTFAAPSGRYSTLAVSPDETSLAAIKDVSPTESDLWIIDLVRGGARRITGGGDKVDGPVWSADGTQLAYCTIVDGIWRIVVRSAAGGEPRVLANPGGSLKYAQSWSPDGRWIVASVLSEKNGWDLWMIPADGSDGARLYAGSSYDENSGRVSPDGRWLSYMSLESGRPEVYVQAFPTPGPRYLVSRGGGDDSEWRADGRQLLYRAPDFMPRIAELEIGGDVRVTRVTPLFSGPRTDDLRRMITGSIGRRFDRMYASIEPQATDDSQPFTIVQNWRSALVPQ